MQAYRGAGDPQRDESPAERLDRNWSELLQGLRVSQTGIQILSGFLLTLPFQSRFAQLSPDLTSVYIAAMVLGGLSTAFIVAPAIAHRVLFRRHAKDLLVRLGNLLALGGLVLLALTLALSLVVVVGFVVGLTAGVLAGVGCLLVVFGLWVVLPLATFGVHNRDSPHPRKG